nr:MAG TPA: hypothetical protein [Microviridae sp.]
MDDNKPYLTPSFLYFFLQFLAKLCHSAQLHQER